MVKQSDPRRFERLFSAQQRELTKAKCALELLLADAKAHEDEEYERGRIAAYNSAISYINSVLELFRMPD